MVARAAAPATPELATQGNGLRVIRYPHQTAKGTTVARNYKLGWVKDEEADRQYKVFMAHWSKMNGKGPQGVIVAMNKTKTKKPRKVAANPHAGKALVVVDPKRAETNRRARENYALKKKQKASVDPDALNQVADLCGVVIASLSAISTTVRMLQDKIVKLQQQH